MNELNFVCIKCVTIITMTKAGQITNFELYHFDTLLLLFWMSFE